MKSICLFFFSFIFIKSKKISRIGGLRSLGVQHHLVLEIPFITLHIIYQHAISSKIPTVQFLHSLDSYISPEECELSSLSILMFRLWAYHQISGNYRLNQQWFVVSRSYLFPLQHYKDPDFKIQYRPVFEIQQAPYQINSVNFGNFQQSLQIDDGMAFLNRSGAPYGDAVVFSKPPIVLQEKQSILSRKNILRDRLPNKIGLLTFSIEREKVQSNTVFVMITDERDRAGITLTSQRDILICWDEAGTETLYSEFAGKFLSLRRITHIGISTTISEMEIDQSR